MFGTFDPMPNVPFWSFCVITFVLLAVTVRNWTTSGAQQHKAIYYVHWISQHNDREQGTFSLFPQMVEILDSLLFFSLPSTPYSPASCSQLYAPKRTICLGLCECVCVCVYVSFSSHRMCLFTSHHHLESISKAFGFETHTDPHADIPARTHTHAHTHTAHTHTATLFLCIFLSLSHTQTHSDTGPPATEHSRPLQQPTVTNWHGSTLNRHNSPWLHYSSLNIMCVCVHVLYTCACLPVSLCACVCVHVRVSRLENVNVFLR